MGCNMSENGLNLKEIEAAGETLGRAYAALFKGFTKGFNECKQIEDITTTASPPESKEEADCKGCWCHECGYWEDCVVKKEGYDPASEPCPCDGCKKGMRYMPKENPPCDKYQKNNE